MATISSAGIGSGINVESVVSQLVSLEKKPLESLQSLASSMQTKLSIYGTIKSQISALGDAAAKLGTDSGWSAVTGTSSNAAAVAVTTGTGAAPGNFTVSVQQLAKAQATASAAVTTGAAVGGGTLSIDLGQWSGGSFTASGTATQVTIDAADTLSQVAAKINDAKSGVTATVLKDASGERLLLRSSATGEAQGFRVQATDNDGNNTDASGLSRLAYDSGLTNGATLTQAGQNANATINGVAISSASNDLKDSLAGVQLKLQQVTTSAVEITIAQDTESLRKNLQAFVDAYNAINSTLSNATKYDETSKTAGLLQGDSTAVGLLNSLRGVMRSALDSGTYQRLNDIGLEMKTGGALSVDNTRLNDAMANPDALKALFTTNTGDNTTSGLGLRIKAFTDGLLDTAGTVTNKQAALKKMIDRNGDEQDRVSDRISRTETRLRNMYTALDTRMAQLNSLSAYVSQQVATWNK